MVSKLIFTLIGLASTFGVYAYAGGSVSYRDEVAPLVMARPDLSAPLMDITLSDSGNGTRISYIMCPALAGKNVGPYQFAAVDQATHRSVIVSFRTRDRFVNSYGVIVAEFFDGEQIAGGDFSNAIKVQEELVGIKVE
jgi:hypothetical protein